MKLFDFLTDPPEAVALEDAATGQTWSYAQLGDAACAAANELKTGRKELVFCFCRQEPRSVIAYLAAIAAGHAVALLDEDMPPPLRATLIERFNPRFVLGPGQPVAVDSRPGVEVPINPELKVLLSTSGTTGSPKFVRLAGRNLNANAESIARYLQLTAEERPIVSLPIHYSYGLSVLHSHLLVGATLVFSPHSVMRPEFWSDFAGRGCTSFAGVPYAYGMLERIGFRAFELPTLRTMTQAGGRMAPEMILRYHEHLDARGARLYVMYGQTEATARISYVPPAALPGKAGSIGIPIPDGELEVVGDKGSTCPQGTVGELVYRGPNVMLGYATRPEDLGLGDDLQGRLLTGDLGFVDADGFFFVTGRSKRIAKIFGLRINLDEVEAALPHTGPTAAVSGVDHIVIFRVGVEGADGERLRKLLSERFNLNPRAFVIRAVDALPLLDSGKVDYRTLGELADET